MRNLSKFEFCSFNFTRKLNKKIKYINIFPIFFLYKNSHSLHLKKRFKKSSREIIIEEFDLLCGFFFKNQNCFNFIYLKTK